MFLIDIPTSRPGSLIELHFLPESRIYGNISPNFEDVQIEDSIIWTELNNNFLKSVGKVRVLCHPAIVETCTAGLKRIDIESALESSYRYVTGM